MGVIFSIHFSFVLATSLLSYLQIGTSDLLGGAKMVPGLFFTSKMPLIESHLVLNSTQQQAC